MCQTITTPSITLSTILKASVFFRMRENTNQDNSEYGHFFTQCTRYKNHEKSSCTNLILTNNTHCFQNSRVFETSRSDFHKITRCYRNENIFPGNQQTTGAINILKKTNSGRNCYQNYAMLISKK